MSDIKKDLAEINDTLNSESPLGRFSRMKEPEFETLSCMWKMAQERLARYQYVCMQISAQAEFYKAQMNAMASGTKLDKSMVESIEEKIAVFEEQLKKGVYF